MESFGKALRRLRGPRSLRDLAARTHISKTHISDLENGVRQPSAEVAGILDAALRAGGLLDELAEQGPAVDLLGQAEQLRIGVGGVLVTGALAEAGIAEWESIVAEHGQATRYRPEADLLGDLLADFGDLQQLMVRRHPAVVQRQLARIAAQMAGLMSLTLLKMGQNAPARRWVRTARQAAAASGDPVVQSWVLAQEAYAAYYAGDMPGAAIIAARAQEIARGAACPGVALAAPLEARAHAMLGAAEEAAGALVRAENALYRLPPELQVRSAFGYDEPQLRFHQGNALTSLRETGRAWEVQQRALELYPASDMTDRALIHLDRAACLLSDGNPGAAAHHAAVTVQELPPDHRSALILYRAREVIAKVPRGVPEVQELHELLELPPGSDEP
jgi:transcriptional regulator with XRE-family HTH domain